MIDVIDATATIFNLVVTAGFVIYCWRVVAIHTRRTQLGKAWIQMAIASLILLAIGVVAFLQVFEVMAVPVWWRNVSAMLFRSYLFIAVVAIFRSWKNLGKSA